jgi:hypothetical protein
LRVSDSRGRVFEIKLAPVIRKTGIAAGKFQMQISKDLISPIRRVFAFSASRAESFCREIFINQRFGFRVFTFEKQPANFGQRLRRVRFIGILRRARPERAFVEDDSFFADTARKPSRPNARCRAAAIA